MRVEVTQEHITRGARFDLNACPIALALKPHYPNSDIEVDVSSVAIEMENELHCWEIFTLPPEAQAFVDAFDDGKTVAPFVFELTEAR